MSNKQTTAVQWLMEQMLSNEFHNPYFEEALRLERKQIEDFAFNFYYDTSTKREVPFNLISENRIIVEEYFTSTFITE